ncbi:unnamed protein product [Absidia cylindrospora]
MDWTGSVGYMYLLAEVDEIYYAKRMGLLSLSKSLRSFKDLASTLNWLFAYQRFALDTGIEARSALGRRLAIDQLSEVVDIQDDMECCNHNIFIIPTKHQSQNCG